MVCAIIQARATSTRLPGKVLREILGRPMLELQIERVKLAKKVDEVILATSDQPSDDPIAELGARVGVKVIRGALDNVVERFYQAALATKAEHLVRLTGDCPLIDPQVIDDVVTFYFNGGFDIASNSREVTFPDGLDTEMFSKKSFEVVHQKAKLPSELEHVTPYLYSHPEEFKIGHYKQARDLSALRWTVDEQADFDVIKSIYEGLYPKNRAFGMNDILKFLDEHPEISDANSGFSRNEGLEKSLQKDLEWIKRGTTT